MDAPLARPGVAASTSLLPPSPVGEKAGASRTWVSNLTCRIKEAQRRRRHREARPRSRSRHHHTLPPHQGPSRSCSTELGRGGLWGLRKLSRATDRGCLLRRAPARAVTNGRLSFRGIAPSPFPLEGSLTGHSLGYTPPSLSSSLLFLHHLSATASHHNTRHRRPPSHQTHPRHLGRGTMTGQPSPVSPTNPPPQIASSNATAASFLSGRQQPSWMTGGPARPYARPPPPRAPVTQTQAVPLPSSKAPQRGTAQDTVAKSQSRNLTRARPVSLACAYL
jgi:hypothetical protein